MASLNNFIILVKIIAKVCPNNIPINLSIPPNPNIIIDQRAVAEENTEEKWLGETNI
jgi:hypothetical protein